jgi:predicted membrane channel-forming protein YqfA (hemolysin III family)
MQICSIGLGCACVSVFDRFRTPAWRPYRAGMFVAMGLSAIFPVLHGLKIYGVNEMRDRIGLTWLVLQGFLYILGAGLYAVSSFSSHDRNILTSLGALARTIMARLFRHLGKFPSDLSYTCCHGGRVPFVRLVEGV